jgi:hypothetical protein
LSEEELKEFQGLVAGAKEEISKMLEKRKKDLSGIEKKEKDLNEIFELSLELAKNFKDKLAESLQENEEFKKFRREYQESFMEGQIVAFLDELLEQENIVANEDREAFVKKVLEGLIK